MKRAGSIIGLVAAALTASSPTAASADGVWCRYVDANENVVFEQSCQVTAGSPLFGCRFQSALNRPYQLQFTPQSRVVVAPACQSGRVDQVNDVDAVVERWRINNREYILAKLENGERIEFEPDVAAARFQVPPWSPTWLEQGQLGTCIEQDGGDITTLSCTSVPICRALRHDEAFACGTLYSLADGRSLVEVTANGVTYFNQTRLSDGGQDSFGGKTCYRYGEPEKRFCFDRVATGTRPSTSRQPIPRIVNPESLLDTPALSVRPNNRPRPEPEASERSTAAQAGDVCPWHRRVFYQQEGFQKWLLYFDDRGHSGTWNTFLEYHVGGRLMSRVYGTHSCGTQSCSLAIVRSYKPYSTDFQNRDAFYQDEDHVVSVEVEEVYYSSARGEGEPDGIILASLRQLLRNNPAYFDAIEHHSSAPRSNYDLRPFSSYFRYFRCRDEPVTAVLEIGTEDESAASKQHGSRARTVGETSADLALSIAHCANTGMTELKVTEQYLSYAEHRDGPEPMIARMLEAGIDRRCVGAVEYSAGERITISHIWMRTKDADYVMSTTGYHEWSSANEPYERLKRPDGDWRQLVSR